MNKRLVFIALLIWGMSVAWTQPRASAPQRPAGGPAPSAAVEYRAVLDQYCVTCHNDRLKTGDLSLESVDLANVSESAEILEKVIRKLRVGMMPPLGMPRPAPATTTAFVSWLETTLDRAAAANPNPGRPLLYRMNRAEYATAIRDLLALEVDPASLLPPDDSGYGFDNVSDVLGISPVLLERYLSAADRVTALAIGDLTIGPGSEVFRVRQDASQNKHIEGLPLGTVGGLLVRPTLPLDGEYLLQVKLFRTNMGTMRGLEYPQTLEFTVDGERVHVASFGGNEEVAASSENPTLTANDVDARLQVRVPLKAGPRAITAAFLQKSSAQNTRRLQPWVRSSSDTVDFAGVPHIDTLTITGPFNPTGVTDTPSRQRIFVCRPTSVAQEAPCARRIISTLARRAYRGQETDADFQRLIGFFEQGRKDSDNFESGIALALRRILASPKFIFRAERDPANVAPGAAYRVSDLELASRLSFFLWSSIPDDQLLEAARQGKLKNSGDLEQQVLRMLADSKSEALTANFAGQWLYLRNLRGLVPNLNEFPDFDDQLRQSFRRETELFFESIMREDRNVVDLLTADYTFVNERLAKHYEIPRIYGSHFRRVTLTDEARKGLLGQGSVLLVTSHPDRTSPVRRGKWVLENILGTPPPPPPPVVPPLKEKSELERPQTMREQMEAHRANPACAGCHKLMDPIGFALENFDAVGAWRTQDEGNAIDASGQLADGTAVDGAVALRQALIRRPDAFVQTVTEKLLTYGLGRGVQYYDMPAIRAIVRDASRQNYRFSSLILGIVKSTPFQMRMKPLPEAAPVNRAAN